MNDLNLGILYWFYKEPEITKNHLELLRKHNPSHKIYGLFGGDPAEQEAYRETLSEFLEDFWTYPGTYGTDSYTKWIHGNLLLLDWYDKRGRDLAWDSIAITQWDMLVFDDIAAQFPGLKQGQIFFSGYRALDETLEKRWLWTDPDNKYRENYDSFRHSMKEVYGLTDMKACLYLFEILPRDFFEKYLTLPDKMAGMLEYKDPTLAVAWGMDIYERDIGVYWSDWREPENAPLIATKKHKVQEEYIQSQLSKVDGWRIFHPYEKTWPL